ncbi:dipeptidase [Naematelia encephala]|uniref:Dipeptidase n=1 Tax=Naematelia encephala TaxID=71784 RepID=A0A1Y2AI52_9TREE|nr:dipeptidase [Naematelia encephala]
MKAYHLLTGLLVAALGAVARSSEALEHALAEALRVMEQHPLIDGHIDLPFIVRSLGPRPLEVIARHNETMPGHVDLERMRQGRLAGLFMVAWIPCPDPWASDDYLDPNNAVRDTLEAIDIIQQMVVSAPNDLTLARNSEEVKQAFESGKISTLIGVEGGHQLGNSLSSLRLYAQLGVRYVTLTHTCHNAFASSAGSGTPIEPAHPSNGLTDFGRELVVEMNRLGVLVDLSHTSYQTMTDAIAISHAPVLFSHSGAAAIYDHPRNVPDSVLALIGDGADQNPGLVMSVFHSPFIDSKNATVERVADHIEHIAVVCGKRHVGISSDFDGTNNAVQGLEDATKYPSLIAELILRGWTEDELADLMGGNLIRILDDADRASGSLAWMPASAATYGRRKDLPAHWGGADDEYLPADVKQYLNQRRQLHDEL